MQENDIRSSIDAITASEEAKNRIYKSVLVKTEAKTQKKRKTSAFFAKSRRTLMPIAACFCIVLFCGVFLFGGGDAGSPVTHRSSAYHTVASVSDFEDIGVFVALPSSAENEMFEIIDGNIASATFDIGGKTYFVKASDISGDFTGVTGEESIVEAFSSKQNGVITKITSYTTTALKAYWTDGKVNFYLYTYADVTLDEFVEVADLIVTK